jgi:CheY-like chemotaxis protein
MLDHPPRSATILVVDDLEAVRQMAVRSLVEQGYRVVQAGDGVEALALFDGGLRVDLVVADIGMPKMGGLQLAKHLTLVAPAPVFLFISGYDQDPVEIPGALLAKPFAPDTLVAEVRRLLSQTTQPDQA